MNFSSNLSPHELVEAGKKELHSQNFQAAHDLLTRAIEQNAAFPDAYYFRAVAKSGLSQQGYQQRQFENVVDMRATAMDDLNECIRLNPEHVDAYLLRSDAHLGFGYNFQNAIGDVQTALNLVPNSVAALLKLAALYSHPMALNRTEALRLVSRATNIDPSNEGAIRLRLNLNTGLGNIKEAIQDLGFLIEKYPTDTKLLLDRYELRDLLYDCKGALADLNSACQVSEEWRLIRGQFYIAHRQFDLAEIDLLAEVKRTEPQFRHFPHMKLAAMYFGLGKFEKALEQVETLLQLGPETMMEPYYSVRAKIYLSSGDTQRALEDCNRVLTSIEEGVAKSPWGTEGNISYLTDRAKVYMKRGAVYTHMKERALAHSDFDTAYKLIMEAKDYEKLGALGETLMSLGNYQGAVTMFSDVIKAVPNSDKAYFQRGKAHTKLNLSDKAIQDFSDCIRLNLRNVKAINARATLYELQGRNDLAAADRKSVADPNMQLHAQSEAFDEWRLFHS